MMTSTVVLAVTLGTAQCRWLPCCVSNVISCLSMADDDV